MALRHLHKSWKYFWKAIFSLLLIVVVVIGGAIGLLQLGATQQIITKKIENNFRDTYNGRLEIGDLDGFLPFNATFKNVAIISSPDSAAADTLLSVKQAKFGIDLWALLQKKLSITDFQLTAPAVRLIGNGEGGYTLSTALKKKNKARADSSSGGNPWIKRVSITAPNLIIRDGSVVVKNLPGGSPNVHFPNPLKFKNINTQVFAELNSTERNVQIEKFSAIAPAFQADTVRISGQVYNDNQSLEFNSFNLAAGHSHLHVNGTIDGVNVYGDHLGNQLANASYDVDISSQRLQLNELTDLFPKVPDIKKPFNFSIKTNGNLNALRLQQLRLGLGESYINIDGKFNHLLNKNKLAYTFNIDTLAALRNDLKSLPASMNPTQYQVLEHLRLNGHARGTADTLLVDVSGHSSLGSFQFNGQSQLKGSRAYKGALMVKNFDIGPIAGTAIDTTSINFQGDVSGANTSLTSGRLRFKGLVKNSFINRLPIDSLRLTTSLLQGKLQTSYYYRSKQQFVQGKASADFSRDDPPITLNGTTRNLNLPVIFPQASFDSTRLNSDYTIGMQGIKPDRMQGMAKLNVQKSVINGDSVAAHQIKIQLSAPDQPSRTLAINSSLFNLKITGDLKPTNITHETTYWTNYFKGRIAQEIRFDSTKFVPPKRAPFVAPMQVKGHLKAKNLTLLKRYMPGFPSLITNSTVQFSLSADSSDLQFSSDIQSDTLRINTVRVKGAGSRFSGHFSHDQTLKEAGKLNFETRARRIESDFIKMDSVDINMNYARDSLYYSQQVKRFSKDSRFNLKVRSKLSKSDITVSIDDFFLGNDQYAWKSEQTPSFTYNRAKKIIFDSFRFRNDDELIALKGALSPVPADSLQYIVNDVQLKRISKLIKGRLNFSGSLNGKLQTRSLTRKPSVQGGLRIDSLKLQNRLLGDVTFSSRFNKAKDRFDTRLKVLTDSSKYQKYLKANKGIGQNILLKGYVKPSNRDTTFHFDANFKEIDMWVVQLLIPTVFSQLEGRATGTGLIAGNLDDLNFKADFQTHHVYAHPEFLQTNYYLDGHVTLDDKKGVGIDNVKITDTKNGTGSLSGSVDFTRSNKQPITTLDLQMKLNDLRFLHSDYDPSAPFFGTMAGTGRVRLSGPTTNLRLETLSDIRVSENSTFGIPLLSQTQISTNNSFIKFVDSFENPSAQKVDLSKQDFQTSGLSKEALQQAIDNLSFGERFNIDMQFVAPKPINVQLVFDPVTEEELHASGTGQLRVNMNEGNLQMFGNFNIADGTYQFVSGEIFSRKLELRSGGNITWEGPPDDANLNVDAVYHARPSAASLNASNADNNQQRVPVDLIVQITGTLSNVQNSYHFEVPQSFQISSASTLQYRLNQINNDEQQKLLQATSILLTGNFLATSQAGQSQTSQLSSSLRRSSTFINPILSNQLISPLLSNQINSLLNTDVTEFNVDFKLNEYNQIDLGVALRLYNDKVILRREGYLTGGASNANFGERIGDLKASYRINNNLSLEAFHRQDQTLGTVISNSQRGDLTPTVNGAGIEAKVQFNTWQQLSHKVHNFFRRLFGKDEIDYKQRSSKQPPYPDSTRTTSVISND